MIDQQTVREALKRHRTANGLSLRAVHKRIGVSITTLCRFEHGRTADMDNLYTIARFVQLPINGYVCDGNTLPNIKAALDADENLDEFGRNILYQLMSVAYREVTKCKH